ncbi:hypothetical protein H5410_031485 [Solanum commersonii]|uniref:Uncharacterized protein n=1 Tax=Solanum commersonii TaxID=4109 RepID=A0A9J5YHB2_SOLCO|nr:hypothetical protein H5410_031485 [Solanum commersonii]
MGEKLIGMGAWSGSGDADAMWNKAASCIREVASKVLGTRKWALRKVYKTTKTEAKLAILRRLRRLLSACMDGGQGGDKKLYSLAKARERKARDLDQVKCIKDEEGKVLVDEISIKQRWRRYFHKLLNEEGGVDIVLNDLAMRKDAGLWMRRCFRIEEVIHAISRMREEAAGR